MDIRQLQKEVPGLNQNILFYWEKKGWIKPERKKGKLRERRVFSDEDVKKIKLIHKYWQEGFTPEDAFRLARKELEENAKYIVHKIPKDDPAYKEISRRVVKEIGKFPHPIEVLSQASDLPSERLRAIVEGDFPTLKELVMIAQAVNKNVGEFTDHISTDFKRKKDRIELGLRTGEFEKKKAATLAKLDMSDYLNMRLVVELLDKLNQ